LLLLSQPAVSEDQPARPGERSVELVAPLKIGHRSVQGRVKPDDVAGMLDEPADNLQTLLLAPPGTSPPIPPDKAKDKTWFDSWAKVATCREWMRLRAAGWYAFDTVDMASDAAFLTACGTLYSVGIGRAAKASYLPQQGLGDLGQYSPLLLGEIGLDGPEEYAGQYLPGNGRSLRDLARDVTPPITIVSAVSSTDRYYYGHDLVSDREIEVVDGGKDTLEYFYDGVSNSLTLLARGDFTGSGLEEFLVFYSLNGGGTLTIGELLVLGRTSETAPIAPVGCILAYGPCELEPELKLLPATPKP
jgi:hypothetical protein